MFWIFFWEDCRIPASFPAFECYTTSSIYQPVSFLEQRSHLCRLGDIMPPVWLLLPPGVLKQGCLWVPASSCTATFTSTNTIFLCNHSIPWEMTERAKKRRRKGRNQGDRRDLGDTGDPWRTNLGGRRVSGINNVIRHLMISFQELFLFCLFIFF